MSNSMSEFEVVGYTAEPGEDPQRRILANLLLMCRREIDATLRPELSSMYAQYVAEIMGSMLSFIEDWIARTPYGQIDECRAALAAQFKEPDSSATHDRIPAFDDVAGADSRLERYVDAADKEPQETFCALVAKIGELHDDLYSAQSRRHEARYSQYRRRMQQLDIDLTPERFDAFLRDRMGITDDNTQSVAKIPGGNSKDTFLVSLQSGRELIVRRDFPFGPTDTSAPDEFAILNRLRANGMPAPRPLFAEFHPQYLGQPALLVEKIPGENALVVAKRDPEVGRFVSFELARLLARLHDIDIEALGFTVGSESAPDRVRAYVAEWRRWWNANRLHPSSLVEAGFHWLDRHIPGEVAKIVPVHGDARPDNMMFHNGEVSALLDWEFLHPGDPSEDLQYAKGFVAPFVSWEEFLEAYRTAGGAPVTDASTRFYDVFRSLRNVVCVDVSWSGFVTGKYPSFKLASQGVFFHHMLSQALAQSLKG
jgi:aminoglycoside phosphotransferase (APT) family kinase protein